RHQKRISVPKSWQTSKKSNKWITSTRPGPHNKQLSIPLGVALRDMLHVVDTRVEAKRVLSEGTILVDGIIRKDLRFPIGLLDVVSIPKMEQSYRVLLDRKGRLELAGTEASKLCKISGKTIIKGGKVQLNLNDGSNLIGSNDFKAKDSVILSVPDKKIIKHIKYEVGNLALIIGGKHTGKIGTIKGINTVRSSNSNTVQIAAEDEEFYTIEDYVVVVGTDKPEIKLGGEVIE
ncbi:MAG TPA: 30S ribosomal protein S4e, partial [Methanomethylovorans sp.]|nr:30S ribosomal protein S4e [Methanomethylovorans sp.]